MLRYSTRLFYQVADFRSYRDVVSLAIVGSSVVGGAFMLVLTSKMVLLFRLGVEQIYLLPISLILMGLIFHLRDHRHDVVASSGPAVLLIPFIRFFLRWPY